MYIEKIRADGYKNLSEIDFSLEKGINIICGENGQGKTNLVEAIWLCTGCRSFRNARDRSFIGFERDTASVSVDFNDGTRTQTAAFDIKKGALKDKLVTLNGVKLKLLSSLFGKLKCVVFTPDDLFIIKGSPENRRSFIDLCASQLKPSFVSALNKYNKLLSQRNAVIKNICFGINSPDDLDVWDMQIAETGSYIYVIRNIYCRDLKKYSSEIYEKICGGKEKADLYYSSTVFEKDVENSIDFKGELKDIYYKKLVSSRNDDVRVGYTLCGVHRDDIVMGINGLDAREYGSQGQQRSAAVSLKLAQAQIIRDQTSDRPVVLLDDVLSELDDSRKKYITDNIEDFQTIITCCDVELIDRSKCSAVFRIENGRLV